MKLVKHLINGEVVSMGDPTQDVYNPSTGEVSKQVEIASKTTTEKAIQAAQEAFPEHNLASKARENKSQAERQRQ